MRDLNYCTTNNIFIDYKEVLNFDGYTRSNLRYPIIYNMKDSKISSSVLKNINSLIYEDVNNFNQGVLEESIQYNSTVSNKTASSTVYNVMTNYNVTMNKNNILSITLNLLAFSDSKFPIYKQINSYNYDLSSGSIIGIKDIFKPSVNFKKLINSKISKQTGKNEIEITDDQSFYLTNDAIVIYFGIDEVPGYKKTIPKFKIYFGDIYPYVEPKFLCMPTDIIYN